ncbi:para-aminobenzoate synthase [Schizosaccharomyces cryophilus OY26]|uniref:aminodeoxychorismate synthase n=1 Tax=Schizosaccharomyces cryophilus (strain OY26 / ATCC MYA-4695 / CBS 11777 / NBRC 106824 / NRRL Y48691) TaxID=653667 RepID=S9W169_SCHCR|nr:para-aminobenzoate synthase [Schizosaccharomyces cryophilus OY26]EPY53703.1 para-aminobenzoate synthase [Schizosaccharomyces cryophilus OY26]
MMTDREKPLRVLLVDCYDSYTFNVHDLIQRASNECSITTVHWDTGGLDLWDSLYFFDAIFIGPGPGSPSEYASVLDKVWHSDIPTLGICLGFQSLALHYGCSVDKMLTLPWHGRISNILTTNDSIFQDLPSVKGMRYHSLCVDSIPTGALRVLAKSVEDQIIMAIEAIEKPHYGILYHPESVGSSDAVSIVQNFLNIVRKFRTKKPTSSSTYTNFDALDIQPSPFIKNPKTPSLRIHSQEIPWVDPLTAVEYLNNANKPVCFLDSAKNPGKFSIIGFFEGPLAHFIHYKKSVNTTFIVNCQNNLEKEYKGDFWESVAKFMEEHKAFPIESALPFHCGIIGAIGYECSEYSSRSIAETSLFPQSHKNNKRNYVDAELAFVDRSIVFDLEKEKAYVQTLLPSDDSIRIWWEDLLFDLQNFQKNKIKTYSFGSVNKIPTEQEYCNHVQKCQQRLLAGDSYEMCLTDTTFVSAHPNMSDYDLYLRARFHNPASFAGFLRFPHLTLLCCSPERFMKFKDSTCHFSPIKGTLRKDLQMTYEEARSKLLNPKDTAELNMIIDLIRNDLHQLAKKNSVEVPQLYQVEEHPTVYSLLSHIYGQVDKPITAWDVLAKCFPPGSMTGAPKLRTVRMLEDLEPHGRGIYSGTLGYWDVSGSSEFNVIIRSAFKYTEDNLWRIGAGGAVTVLSTSLGEYEEMLLKANSILPAFCKIDLEQKKT